MSRETVFPRARSRREEWMARNSLKTFVGAIAIVLLLNLLIISPRIQAGNFKDVHAPPGIRATELRTASRRAAVNAPRIRLWDESPGSDYSLNGDLPGSR